MKGQYILSKDQYMIFEDGNASYNGSIYNRRLMLTNKNLVVAAQGFSEKYELIPLKEIRMINGVPQIAVTSNKGSPAFAVILNNGSRETFSFYSLRSNRVNQYIHEIKGILMGDSYLINSSGPAKDNNLVGTLMDAYVGLFGIGQGTDYTRPQEQIIDMHSPAQKSYSENLYDLFTKFAICCYIAFADGKLSPTEKKALDSMFLDIYKKYNKDDRVKQVLLKIYNTPKADFIFLEQFLSKSNPDTILAYVQVGEEIASIDGSLSDPELERIYRIRKYITELSGKDYMGLKYSNADDLKCPGCTAMMEIQPFLNMAVCPYCGNKKQLKVADSSNSSMIRHNCPHCNTVLMLNSVHKEYRCPKCNKEFSI